MRRNILHAALLAAPLALFSSAAMAADPCGNIELVASGSCEFVTVAGGCVGQCEPINLTAACDGQCTVQASAECSGGCELDCKAKCDPGHIDCTGSCKSSCYASCTGTCSDTGCRDECEASCDNRCEVSCEAQLPSCEASCQAACNASCSVQANVQCHADCTARLEGGCQLQCQEPRGALFCNGQYVDVTSDFDACITYLETKGLNVNVAATCNGLGCSATVGCALAKEGVGADREGLGAAGIAALLGAVGLFASRRRRSR
jgi:hypothetical protein